MYCNMFTFFSSYHDVMLHGTVIIIIIIIIIFAAQIFDNIYLFTVH